MIACILTMQRCSHSCLILFNVIQGRVLAQNALCLSGLELKDAPGKVP